MGLKIVGVVIALLSFIVFMFGLFWWSQSNLASPLKEFAIVSLILSGLITLGTGMLFFTIAEIRDLIRRIKVTVGDELKEYEQLKSEYKLLIESDFNSPKSYSCYNRLYDLAGDLGMRKDLQEFRDSLRKVGND